ncbi:uncharacterized protein LOC133371758 [Rhineura floridana]|uniref:uncharacterized protein LOC133371758 n=1 Tax=Rhineura floridana TaxID=261503 RepID=UPI002AC7EFC5|nr:uncharacterized protein LOC133371758 [Rhineura floridana]
MILLSLTPIGMRLLAKLDLYCKNEGLQINYKKTKIMVFGNRYRHRTWTIGNHSIDQCRSFKYLGIHFQHTLAWKSHLTAVKLAATRSAGAILKFYRTAGGHLVPPALKIFQSKVISQITYRAAIWGWLVPSFSALEAIQNNFLSRLLCVPPGTPAAFLRAETGFLSISARIHETLLLYWAALPNSTSKVLVKTCFDSAVADRYWSSKFRAVYAHYHIPIQSISTLHRYNFRAQIERHSVWWDRLAISNSKFSRWYGLVKTNHLRANYLSCLLSVQLRYAFTALRFQTMPSAILHGRYHQIQYEQRFCICQQGKVEDFIHYLFDCPIYNHPRSKFLDGLINRQSYNLEDHLVPLLLADNNFQTTYSVAQYALAAQKLRANFLKDIGLQE